MRISNHTFLLLCLTLPFDTYALNCDLNTANNEYLVTSYLDLKKVGVDCPLSGSYRQTADIDASNSKSENCAADASDLDQDKDVSEQICLGFLPIGDLTNPFTGSYQGGGHVISGLRIYRPKSLWVGLFGYMNNTNPAITIDSIALKHVDITGDRYVGGLIGYSIGYNVDFAYASGSVYGLTSGGLIGRSNGVISRSFASGEVGSPASVAGGLVGELWQGTIQNSFATSTVNARDWGAGGLIGNAYSASIQNSYATGIVKSLSSVAGLCGVAEQSILTVLNSYSAVQLSGNQKMGGFVGTAPVAPVLTNSFWNSSWSMKTDMNYDTKLNTPEMKAMNSFFVTGSATKNWDFINIWKINEGVTFPYFDQLGNAPVGFPDELTSTSAIPISTFTSNDSTFGASAIIFKMIKSSGGGTFDNTQYTFPTSATFGFRDTITYHIGVSKSWASNTDTLWSNYTQAIVQKGSCKLSGAGTELSPYLVSTYSELKMVGVSSSTSVCPLYAVYRQTADIDASPSAQENGVGSPVEYYGFAPIGTNILPFTGNYHGAGHTISNLLINRLSSESAGLFGNVEGRAPVIDSLGIINANVKAGFSTGLLVGKITNGKVNCIFATGSASKSMITGGLIGVGEETSLADAYFEGTVSGMSAGGLIGQASGTVQNSYAIAKATTDLITPGGIIGNNNFTVTASFWNSDSCATSNNSGTGKSTSSLKQQATFTNWDFTNTWVMYPGKTYPLLRAFMKPLTVSAKAATKTYDGKAFNTPTVTYDLASVDTKLILGTPTFSGTGIGAINAGTYTLKATGGLYSSQLGYIISYSPTDSKLNITKATGVIAHNNNPEFTGMAQASIMDMQGRLAWSGDLYVNDGHFSLPSIGAGQWVVKLRMGNDVVVETKIVE